jgi:hypothetical protein
MCVNDINCLPPSPTERARNGVVVGIHHLLYSRSFVKNLLAVSKAFPKNEICCTESDMADNREGCNANAAALW